MNTEEPIEGELIQQIDGGEMLAALNKSEIDQQISTAKAFPRSIKKFKNAAMEMATLDKETAMSMFYVLPRGGKRIEGASVRLAEVVGSCWGNVRYGSRVVSTDRKFITAQGVCYDLEKNVSVTIEVKVRITDRNGMPYKDDMLQVAGNAACSKALRNAIFKVIPAALTKTILDAAKDTSIGKNMPMATRRQNAIEWMTKMGANEQMVLELLGKDGVDDISRDDLILLTGLGTAIKDGETTVEQAFAKQEAQTGSRVQESSLNDKLNSDPAPKRKKTTKKKPAETPPPAGGGPGVFEELRDVILSASDWDVSETNALNARDSKQITPEQFDKLAAMIADAREAMK